MAKKKASETQDDRPKGRGTKQSKVLTPADLREMAAALKGISDEVARYAGDLEQLEVDSFPALVGNWHNGIETIRGWVNGQIIPVILREATNKGEVFDLRLNRSGQ